MARTIPSIPAGIPPWNVTLPLYQETLYSSSPSIWTAHVTWLSNVQWDIIRWNISRGLKSTCTGWTPFLWLWLEAMMWMSLSHMDGWGALSCRAWHPAVSEAILSRPAPVRPPDAWSQMHDPRWDQQKTQGAKVCLNCYPRELSTNKWLLF